MKQKLSKREKQLLKAYEQLALDYERLNRKWGKVASIITILAVFITYVWAFYQWMM